MATADKTKLKDPLPKVVVALEELLQVLTGGNYVSNSFWQAADQTAAGNYIKGLTIGTKLHDTLSKVTSVAPIKGAMTDATKAIQGFLDTVNKQTSSITNDAIGPITHLNNPHPSGNYTADDFGFFGAILGIGSAAGADLSSVQSALNTVIGYAADSVTYTYFATLATETIGKLTQALS